MFRGSSKGFTLIEMLIVIAVISILAGIVLVGITGFQSSARDTKRVGDLSSIRNNLELYFTRCGHYPTSGTCGSPSGTGSSLSWDALGTELANQDIIVSSDRLSTDPRSGQSYVYAYGDDGLSYILGATMENDGTQSLNPGSGDLDGNPPSGFTGNISCDDPVYCVGSE